MVEKIDKLLFDLLPLIEEYQKGKLPGEKLEEKTGELIIHDDFEKLSELEQNNILTLDSWDIHDLKEQDLQEIKEELENAVRGRSKT